MSRYYAIRYLNGQHVVGVTTDGCDWIALPRSAFGRPRDAIRYAEMRQANVSPLRVEQDAALTSVGDIPAQLPAATLDGRPSGIRQ